MNSKAVKDAYAIPRIEDSLHLLAGSKYFCKLDLRCEYWQVEIDEEDIAKTAFQVGSLGLFWPRMTKFIKERVQKCGS